MAISFVQGTGQAWATGTTITKAYASANTAGNFLIAVATDYYPGDTPAISDTQGNTWQTAIIYNASETIGIFYVPNCKAGSNTVTASIPLVNSASFPVGGLHISEFSGASTSSPYVDQTEGGFYGTITTSPTMGAVTTTSAGELVIACIIGNYTCTAGPGYTSIAIMNNDCSEYLLQSSAGSVAPSWVQAQAGYCTAAMATFLAGSGATVSKHFLSLMGCGA